jgi:hypothetical protein
MTKRRTVDLAQVAEIYTQAAEAGEPPTTTVAETFGATISTASKWVMAARRTGLLQPARKGSSPRRHPALVRIADDLGVSYDDLRDAILRHIPSGHISLLSDSYRKTG